MESARGPVSLARQAWRAQLTLHSARTVSNCENHGDLYDIIDAPTGMFGITHDDGPTPASPELYRFLESQGQASTHFLIGSNILNNPEGESESFRRL